jgi:hypothetical protein
MVPNVLLVLPASHAAMAIPFGLTIVFIKHVA